MTALKIARGLALDADLAGGWTFGILAKKGAGKTYTGRVLAEEMESVGIPFVALDPTGAWWGLRAGADGQASGGIKAYVFGGDHGDVPLEPTAGKLMADLVVDERLPMVLDLSAFGTRASERTFARDFLDRLYRRNRDLVHLFVDEADLFAPQRPQSGDQPLLGVMENLVRRGRIKGIGCTLISQRPAVLNKDVLTQVDVLVAMRITSPQDRGAIGDWIKGHDEQGQGNEVLGSLASLANGEGWVWAPELNILQRVAIRAARTFDSSPTPRRGTQQRKRTVLADVDLHAIGEKIAATVQRAKAEDPKALRRRVKELEAKLADQPDLEPIIETVEVPVIGDQQLEQLRGLADELGALATDVAQATQALTLAVQQVVQTPVRAPAPRRPAPASPPPTAPTPTVDGEPQLKAGARRILEQLARHHPMRFTKAQIGTLVGMKVSGGTFNTYWSVLRRAGYIDEQGDDFGITPAGLERTGVVPTAPATTEEMVEMWRARLKAGARRMLDILVEHYPQALAKDDLAAELDMEPSGGTFNTYVSTLRRNGLAEVDGGMVTASDTLFIA
jgi:uncharacterized coiled-coil protein SlyX